MTKDRDRVADEATVREFAWKAYNDLGDSGYPEFGEEVRGAIVDTAADALADAGFDFDRAVLVAEAGRLA